MQNYFESRHALGPEEVKGLNTTQLRDAFLIKNIFIEDLLTITLCYFDRYITGGAMPVNKSLHLSNPENIKAKYFLERRELGIINVGERGTVTVDGTAYELEYKEALYIGRGTEEIIFSP